jgi:hypothetical protein
MGADLELDRCLDLGCLLFRRARKLLKPLQVLAVDAIYRQVVTEPLHRDGLLDERMRLRAVLADVEVAVALVEPSAPSPESADADQVALVVEMRD